MASDERLKHEGLLKEKEQRAKYLAILMHGLKERIRTQTDVHLQIENLDVSVLRVTVDELTNHNQEYERLLKEIAALREDLGLPRYEAR